MECSHDSVAEWLLANGGPIIRYRVATELLADRGDIDRAQLRRDLLACPEVKRWLANLGQGPIHHSCDTSAENSLGKLLEYGVVAGMADVDEKVRPFFNRYGDFDDALILTPFLARAGYSQHPVVAEWFSRRIEALHRTAQRGTRSISTCPKRRRPSSPRPGAASPSTAPNSTRSAPTSRCRPASISTPWRIGPKTILRRTG